MKYMRWGILLELFTNFGQFGCETVQVRDCSAPDARFWEFGDNGSGVDYYARI